MFTSALPAQKESIAESKDRKLQEIVIRARKEHTINIADKQDALAVPLRKALDGLTVQVVTQEDMSPIQKQWHVKFVTRE